MKKATTPGGKKLQKAGFRLRAEVMTDEGRPLWYVTDRGVVLRQTPSVWHLFSSRGAFSAETAEDLAHHRHGLSLHEGAVRRMRKLLFTAPQKLSHAHPELMRAQVDALYDQHAAKKKARPLGRRAHAAGRRRRGRR